MAFHRHPVLPIDVSIPALVHSDARRSWCNVRAVSNSGEKRHNDMCDTPELPAPFSLWNR
eukprot:5626960-Amphidinium_carterae.1